MEPYNSEGRILLRNIRAVYFDLGGVYYCEGFREGLFSIARGAGLEGSSFYQQALELVFSSGYVCGKIPEKIYWEQLANLSGLKNPASEYRKEIIRAFKPMKGMGELARKLREKVKVALLTDQTNWLYDLDERDGIFSEFDEIISSYEEGFSKKNMEIFRIACERCDILPEEGVFFDDNPGNIQRAAEFGLNAYLFEEPGTAEKVLESIGVFDKRPEKDHQEK